MMISYVQKGNELIFLNTYSTFDSTINGFNKDIKKYTKEKGLEPTDIAGKEAFISSMSFNCSYDKSEKKCKSIKEMESWIKSKLIIDENGIVHLPDIKVIVQFNPLPENEKEIKVLNATTPVFFGEMKTNSDFIYDMFEKKTKNWQVIKA